MNKLYKIAHFFHRKKLFLFPIVLFVLLFLGSLHRRDLVIYPNFDQLEICHFDDKTDGGNSSVEYFNVDDTGISLDYTLREALFYPFAGIVLRLFTDSIFQDFSSYDYISFDFSFRKQQNIDIFFHNYIPGHTELQNTITFRFLYRYLVGLNPEQTFTVPLSSFETPAWWYYHNELTENSLGQDDFRRVAEIIIQSGSNIPPNRTFGFTVKKVSLHRDIKKHALNYGIASLGWLLLYFSLFFISRMAVKNRKLVVFYEPAQLTNDSDDTVQRILDFIAREYKDRYLTVNRVAEQVGVSQLKVTQVLREKIGCSYKQYLNSVRLAEAKRLLLQTDRNIVEIALKVGYNNVTHFNRIFKQTEGIPPREFRSSNSRTKTGEEKNPWKTDEKESV